MNLRRAQECWSAKKQPTMTATNDRATWIKGDQAHCNCPPAETPYPFRFILLGAPYVERLRGNPALNS